MGRAMELPSDTKILAGNQSLTFKEGVYQWVIERQGDASTYTVTDGTAKISVPVRWIFGHGAAGQTYVLEHQGKLYESRVSFYNAIQGLDLTMGAQASRPTNLTEALGRLMSDGESRACFGCHAST